MEQAYVQLCLGLDYKRGGFVDRAFQSFSEVVQLDPGNQYALLNLEKIHEEQQQWQEARAIRQRITNIAPAGEKPRDQAILAFLENELGLQSVRNGAPDQAIRHFETALDLDSRTVPASLNLGDVYMMQGRTTEAIAMWEQISRTAPDRSYLAFDRLERAYGRLEGPERLREPLPAPDRRQPPGLAGAPDARTALREPRRPDPGPRSFLRIPRAQSPCAGRAPGDLACADDPSISTPSWCAATSS